MNQSPQAKVSILEAKLFVQNQKVKNLEDCLREVTDFLEEQVNLGLLSNLTAQDLSSVILGKIKGEVNVQH